MQEVFKILIGIAVLLLGIPIGDLLAKNTKDELKEGKKWFIIIIFLSMIGAVLNLIFSNDALLFTFLFIAIVTSRSIVKRKNKIKQKQAKKKK